MNDNSLVWVKINTSNYYKILLKLNSIGIEFYDNKVGNDYILIKIKSSDYEKIKKYLISYETSMFDVTGIPKIKNIFSNNFVYIISVIIAIIMLFIVNNIIFKVDIKTYNPEIKKTLYSELKKYGLGTMRIKIKHKNVEKIVNKILDDNKDLIEWLEIKYDGLIMVVNVTEKTIIEETIKHNHCNIIASTDAKISGLNINRGVALKEVNDYVSKGDILLSGSIIHNEEVKNTVCASGNVYGEVWYTIKVEIPFVEYYKVYTGTNRYNLNIKLGDNNYKIFKNRIDKYSEKKTNLYKLNDFEINLVKEKEYVIKTKHMSEQEAYDKGINTALEKVNLKLAEEEEILYKKVLKKVVNDSTIYLEIFVVTKENIGELQIIEE